MNGGRILVFHFLQWIPILRTTLISDRPQTLFTMDPDSKGHAIWDSLETLQALSIENNTIGDPLSLTKCKALPNIFTKHQFHGVLQGNFATCGLVMNMHNTANLFDWKNAKKLNPYNKNKTKFIYLWSIHNSLYTNHPHEGVMCIQNFQMLWRAI
jgi:hypothetical protein